MSYREVVGKEAALGLDVFAFWFSKALQDILKFKYIWLELRSEVLDVSVFVLYRI